MSTRIRFRRDTAANWTSNNPTLTTGELGYETDTGKFKIGNNTDAWTALPYSITAELSEGNLNDLKDVTITSAANGDFLRWNGTAWINDAVNLSTDTIGSFVESLVAGTGITLTNNSGEGATPTVAVTTNTFDAYGAASTAATNAATALTNHEADTTSIHGIADTSILVTTTGSQTLTNKTITSPSGLVKGDVGLGSVDNTADTAKPVSTAQQTALDLKANLASPTFTGTATANDLTVSGNLTVSGTTTSINTETLTVDDNIIILNNNATGAPSANAGIEIERGSSANVALRWNETSDKWELTTDGSTYVDIATETYAASLTPATLDAIGDVTITSASSGQFLKWNGTAWVNDAIDLSTDTTGDYVATLTAGTGITLSNNSGEGASPTVTVDTTTIQARVTNVTDTEIGYLDGVTSAIQTQIDTKAPIASPTFTGTVVLPATTSIDTVSATEISYLDGVSSAIQTQLNTKASTGKAIAMAIVFGG